MTVFKLSLRRISPERMFMASALLVNGGNYLYNLFLGRILGPAAFADAALMITLLLVLSFMGMTFQLVASKFAVVFSPEQYTAFQAILYKYALGIGLLLGGITVIFATELQKLFQTQSAAMFTIFGLGIPIYFVMSVNRGNFQGFQLFNKLSLTYQTEMWSRLLLTILLLVFIPWEPAFLVAFGIIISFLFGILPIDYKKIKWTTTTKLSTINRKKVKHFVIITSGYELTQIIINNSDILLVKHYFEALDAGMYASLALIGRVVYFVAWMFVMLLLPTVIQKKKNGEATKPILQKYVGYISVLSLSIVAICYLFPEIIIQLLFGDAYVAMSTLLWQYAMATALFAISNVFTYYFLSLDHYIPVIISGVLGVSQIICIIFFHTSLAMIVQLQILVMTALLTSQILYYYGKSI